MKANLLLVPLLAALASCATGAAQKPAVAVVQDDPCRAPAPVDVAAESTCGGAPFCTAAARTKVACDLRDAMADRYVFFDVKPRLLAAASLPSVEPRRVLDACVHAEQAIRSEPDPLRFVDRLRACTAALDDGHLILSATERLPKVALGVALRVAADGRVYVASRDPALARAVAARDPSVDAALAVGAEVLAIDGRPVGELLRELGRYVPASSPGARLERAVDALTRRDFAYPARASATLELAAGDARRTVTLPWWIAPSGPTHPLTRAWVARTGVQTTDLVDWRPDASGAWVRDGDAFDGVVRGDTILDPAAARRLVSYRGDGGQLAARLGEVDGGRGSRYCYAQLLTFHTEHLADGGPRRPYAAVLADFLAQCSARGEDLVLDLRQNEGGYLSHSTDLAALLTKPGAAASAGALLLRATDQNERVYRARATPASGTGTGSALLSWLRGDDDGPAGVLRAIERARRGNRPFTPAFLEPVQSRAQRPYEGHVVALTTPSCMSACDRLAALLRGAGRATLVGGATEGAGASQQETEGVSARWRESTGLLAVSIPNAAMGVEDARTRHAGPVDAERFFTSLAIENRPVQPHVPYATTRDDLVGHNRGWRAQAEAALEAARRAAPGGGSDEVVRRDDRSAPARADRAERVGLASGG